MSMSPRTRTMPTDEPGSIGAGCFASLDEPAPMTGITPAAENCGMKRFMPQFAAAGVMPVMGAGSSSEAKQPAPIEPGSSVGIVLVRGDMDISATCTVTYIDPKRLLACGHPLMQFGKVDMPMTKSTVLATLPSPLNA